MERTGWIAGLVCHSRNKRDSGNITPTYFFRRNGRTHRMDTSRKKEVVQLKGSMPWHQKRDNDVLTDRAGSDESEDDDPDTISTWRTTKVKPEAERLNKEVVLYCTNHRVGTEWWSSARLEKKDDTTNSKCNYNRRTWGPRKCGK